MVAVGNRAVARERLLLGLPPPTKPTGMSRPGSVIRAKDSVRLLVPKSVVRVAQTGQAATRPEPTLRQTIVILKT